jgi:hypothetical protein
MWLFSGEPVSTFDARLQRTAVAMVFPLLQILLALQLRQRRVRDRPSVQTVHAPKATQAPEREAGSSALSLALLTPVPVEPMHSLSGLDLIQESLSQANRAGLPHRLPKPRVLQDTPQTLALVSSQVSVLWRNDQHRNAVWSRIESRTPLVMCLAKDEFQES